MRRVTGKTYESQFTIEGDQTLVKLQGEIDGAATTVLTPLVSEATDDFVVDASEVTFIDSMGLRMLLSWQKSIQVRGGTLSLCSPSDPVIALLRTTGLESVFHTVTRDQLVPSDAR